MPDRRTVPGRLRTRRRSLEDRIALRVLRIVGAADGAGRDDRRTARERMLQVWPTWRDKVWAVADLVADGLIDRRESQSFGQLLGRITRNGPAVLGDLVLHGVGDDRNGRLWCLRRLRR